jgi:hypothetical protein
MSLVVCWYSKKPNRDRITWAVILVVIALGLQSQIPGNSAGSNSTQNTHLVDYGMRNVQSVIPELVTNNGDLLSIQIMLTLALLFQNSSDVRLAGALLGIVVKLSHRMQLHSSDSAHYFSTDESIQRLRVFWIMYILDKV